MRSLAQFCCRCCGFFVLFCFVFLFVCSFVQCKWGTADAEIKVFSFENPEVLRVLQFKPRAGQNLAKHASPTARIFFPLSDSYTASDQFKIPLPRFFFFFFACVRNGKQRFLCGPAKSNRSSGSLSQTGD